MLRFPLLRLGLEALCFLVAVGADLVLKCLRVLPSNASSEDVACELANRGGDAKTRFKTVFPRSTFESRGDCGILSGVSTEKGLLCPCAESADSGRRFSLENRIFTVKSYLQVKGMMHPILNHCFSPGGLYYAERTCVCTYTCMRARTPPPPPYF